MQALYPRVAFLPCYGPGWTLRCVSRSTSIVPFSYLALPSAADEFKEGNASLLKERLSPIHDLGSLNTTDLKCQLTMLSNIEKDIDKLEDVLSKDEDMYGRYLSMDTTGEVQHKSSTLQEEILNLRALLDSKDESLNDSFEVAIQLRTHLQDAEAQANSFRLFKESHDIKQAEAVSRLQRLSSESLEILDKHLNTYEAIGKSMEEVGKVWESILSIHNLAPPSKLIDILQKEACYYFQSLLISTEALSKAEGEVSSLTQKLISTEVLLGKERQALKAMRDGLEKLDRALSSEESKVDDLFKEVSSLKAQLEQKESAVRTLTNEAFKNKGLQEIAKKHLNAFQESEKKVQQLSAQSKSFENEIKSKDLLLVKMKKEAFEKTEALRLAAQIKQELNLCRHHEVQLTQELERERMQVKELSQEIMENPRAVKAELALRQAEKNMMESSREMALLQNGIVSRDGIIKLMQEKIDGHVQILQNAVKDREVMRMMEARIKSLESKRREFL